MSTQRAIIVKKLHSMKQRCYNPNNKDFKNYGGRGISVCEEWLSDSDAFVSWALENGYKEGLTIDRIDVNKNYSPDNCRFIEMEKQQSNKRTNVFVEVYGKQMTLSDAAKVLRISEGAVWRRYRKGMKIDAPKYIWKKPVQRSDGVVFMSVKDAAKSVGVSDSKVSEVCKGKRTKTGGYSFWYITREEAEAALAALEGQEKHPPELTET